MGTIARTGSTALAMIGGLTGTALSVRLLSTAEYGGLALGLAITRLVTSGAGFGVGPGIAQSLMAAHARGDFGRLQTIARAVVSTVVLTSAAGILVLVASVYTALRAFGPTTAITVGIGLGLFLFGRTAVDGASSIAQGLGRVVLMELPPLALAVVQPLAILVMWKLQLVTIETAALTFGAAGVIAALVSGELARRLLPGTRGLFRISIAGTSRLMALAAPFAIVAVATQLMGQFDVLVLGLTNSTFAVGLYEPALRLTDRLLLLVPGLVVGAYVPAATRLFAQGHAVAFGHVFVRLSKAAFVGTIPAIMVLVALPDLTMRLIYGPAYPPDNFVVWILMVGYVVNLAGGLNAQALMATGSRAQLTRVFILVLVTMITTGIVLIPPLGARGAAVATAITYTVLNISAGRALFTLTHAHPFRRDFALTVASSSIPVTASVVLRDALIASGPLAAFAGVVVLWIVWVATLLLTPALKLTDLTEFFGRGARSARVDTVRIEGHPDN